MRLQVEDGLLAVCRLAADDPVPDWAQGRFLAIVRTAAELSIVCAADARTVPNDRVITPNVTRAPLINRLLPASVTRFSSCSAATGAPTSALLTQYWNPCTGSTLST